MTPDRDDAQELRGAFLGLRTRLAAHLAPGGLDALAEQTARAVRARAGVEQPVRASRGNTGSTEHHDPETAEPPAVHSTETVGAARRSTTDTAQFGTGATDAAATEPVVCAVLAAALECAIEQIVTNTERALAGLDARDAGVRRTLGRSVVAQLLGTDRLPRAWAIAVWPLVAGAIRSFLARRTDVRLSGAPNWAIVDRHWRSIASTDPGAAGVFALREFAGLSWDDVAVLTGRTRSDAIEVHRRVEHTVFGPGI